jgi:hypothetical protein
MQRKSCPSRMSAKRDFWCFVKVPKPLNSSLRFGAILCFQELLDPGLRRDDVEWTFYDSIIFDFVHKEKCDRFGG